MSNEQRYKMALEAIANLPYTNVYKDKANSSDLMRSIADTALEGGEDKIAVNINGKDVFYNRDELEYVLAYGRD